MSDITLKLNSSCYHGEDSLSYASDSLITFNYFNGSHCSHFQKALAETRRLVKHPLYHEWRLQIALELQLNIITRCMRSGEQYMYAECGIGEGHTLLMSYNYFSSLSEEYASCFLNGSKLLMDTFEGLDEKYVNMAGLDSSLADAYHGTTYDVFRQRIINIPNCTVIPGTIPESLPNIPAKLTAPDFLHIDMNHYVPEVAALDFFGPNMKRGSIVLFDDYSFANNHQQREEINKWCAKKKYSRPINLPTGQALMIL